MSHSTVKYVGKHPTINNTTPNVKDCVERLPKSKDHSPSEYFGPGIWYSLHSLAYNADNGRIRKTTFVEFAEMLRRTFPCPECRRHYNSYVEQNPIPQVKYFEWTVNFHNTVNRRLSHKYGVKKCTFTIEEARKAVHMLQKGLNTDGSRCTSCG